MSNAYIILVREFYGHFREQRTEQWIILNVWFEILATVNVKIMYRLIGWESWSL